MYVTAQDEEDPTFELDPIPVGSLIYYESSKNLTMKTEIGESILIDSSPSPVSSLALTPVDEIPAAPASGLIIYAFDNEGVIEARVLFANEEDKLLADDQSE